MGMKARIQGPNCVPGSKNDLYEKILTMGRYIESIYSMCQPVRCHSRAV